jgi:tetratricopeptide (TPR) repeat protein
VVAGYLFCSPAARAQDDPTTTAAARERFKEGVAYFDRKEYEKARAAFLQAYALKKHPAVLLNLAQSELRSGHERDAAMHFSQYLREATDASAAERDVAQAGLASARAALIEVVVSVDEPGAEIFVDGTAEGSSPLSDPLFLEPGSHSIEAKKGDKRATQNVSGKAGERKESRLALAVPSPVAAAPTATEQPSEAAESEAVETSVSTGGREPFLRWVTTRPAGIIPASATILLGLGAGGFAIGSNIRYSDADSTAESINKAAALDDISTQGICVDPEGKVNGSASVPAEDKPGRIQQYEDACAKHQDFVDQGDAFKSVAIGLGVGAGVAAVATVVLYFTTAPNTGSTSAEASSAPDVAVLPWATPASGGFAVFGRF